MSRFSKSTFHLTQFNEPLLGNLLGNSFYFFVCCFFGVTCRHPVRTCPTWEGFDIITVEERKSGPVIG